MAENHLPAPWCPRNEIIRTEHGGWISGGSASDQILPADLEPHDVIVHGDRAVIVERTRPSLAPPGSSRGTLARQAACSTWTAASGSLVW